MPLTLLFSLFCSIFPLSSFSSLSLSFISPPLFTLSFSLFSFHSFSQYYCLPSWTVPRSGQPGWGCRGCLSDGTSGLLAVYVDGRLRSIPVSDYIFTTAAEKQVPYPTHLSLSLSLSLVPCYLDTFRLPFPFFPFIFSPLLSSPLCFLLSSLSLLIYIFLSSLFPFHFSFCLFFLLFFSPTLFFPLTPFLSFLPSPSSPSPHSSSHDFLI
ncbi:unnamed protein product [Acanthosepion pharaonis]|uniref:Uncharacterized protein n=1 Tax=Acanthosepion pharaonis TaxID=158019 RepID=A0A812EU71_ACAPH|nr:unnamed protein product [Sepia pharaonis]